MRKLLFVGLIVCVSTTARSSEPINADAWVAQVLAGPAGLAAAAQVGRARADVDAAGLWPNPGLRLERQSGPLLDPRSALAGGLDQSQGSQDFVAVEFPLALNGRLGLAHDAAERRAEAAVIDAHQSRARLAREAIEVFVDVVGGGRRVRAFDEERTRMAPVVEAARRRADAGESPAATALRLELELARVDDEAAAARAAVDSAKHRAEALIEGVLPVFADVFPVARQGSSLSPAGVLSLKKRADAAALDEDAASRRLIPDVVVGGGPSLLNTGSAAFSVGYLVTVGVELPLFDRGQGDAARARAERVALGTEAAALTRRLDGARADALVRAQAARSRSEAFGLAVDRAKGLFDAAARDLTLGAGDVVAFVDATGALRDARLQLVGLQEAVARADADLSFFNGALDSSPETPR